MVDGKLNAKLLFAVIAAALGSGFQHGYHTGVVNVPDRVLKQWINDTNSIGDNERKLTLLWSISTSIMNFGGTLGGVCTGLASIHLGPKTALLFNNSLAALACLLMTISKYIKSFPVYVIGRFVIGINCGLNAGLCPMYLSEIAPVNMRGAIGSVYQLVITISILVAQFVGLGMIFGAEDRWPILFILPFVFIVIQVLMLPFCSESPRYLVGKQKEEKAETALSWLRNGADTSEEMAEIKAEDAETKSLPKITIRDMFKERYLRYPLLVALVIMTAQQFSGINAVIFYSTSTFTGSAKLSHVNAQYATMGVGVTNVLMTVISMYIVDKAGRKTLLLIAFAGMAIVQALMTVFCLYRDISPLGYIVIVLVLIYIILFASGAGSIPWFLTAEMFNQAARPTAVSFAVPTNWIANFIITLAFPTVEEALHSYVFLIFTAFNICFVLFILKFVHETKNKTIEEITHGFR